MHARFLPTNSGQSVGMVRHDAPRRVAQEHARRNDAWFASWERCESKGSRTVLRGGEIPPEQNGIRRARASAAAVTVAMSYFRLAVTLPDSVSLEKDAADNAVCLPQLKRLGEAFDNSRRERRVGFSPTRFWRVASGPQ